MFLQIILESLTIRLYHTFYTSERRIKVVTLTRLREAIFKILCPYFSFKLNLFMHIKAIKKTLSLLKLQTGLKGRLCQIGFHPNTER